MRDVASALAGVAALGSAQPAEATPTTRQAGFRSQAGVVVPFSEADLLPPGPPRSYAGAALAEIAFPLGGIGTGTVSLGGRGQLRDWEIFNRPNKGQGLPSTFVAIRVQASGAEPLIRVAEAVPGPPYRGAGTGG